MMTLSEAIERICELITNHSPIFITYKSDTNKNKKSRIFEPHVLYKHKGTGNILLIGIDREINEIRTFDITDIVEIDDSIRNWNFKETNGLMPKDSDIAALYCSIYPKL